MFTMLMVVIWLLSPIWISLLILLINGTIFFIQYRFVKKMRVPTSLYEKRKPDGFFKRLFWLFPQRFIDDLFNRDPDAFSMHGLHMFCGEQGSGKTTAIAHMLLELKDKYPAVKVRTNMNYLHQDGEITHWKELVKNENGIYGQIEVLDEIQTWFSSNLSKDFPVDMITEISQQRKQRKALIGSAQVFSRIAKPIREQTTRVYLPVTFFGCLTWVRVSKPQYWDDEKQQFKRFIKHYFFVHTAEIRDSFDTYKKIEKYNEFGFKEDSVTASLRS